MKPDCIQKSPIRLKLNPKKSNGPERNPNRKTCGLSETGPYKQKLYSCGHLDSPVFLIGYYK